MVFSDLFFLFVFIPLFALCYLIASLIEKPREDSDKIESFAFRNSILVVFSLIFYAWGEPVYVFLMIGSVFVNYLIGLLIHRNKNGKRKAALAFGVTFNLILLGTFKYLGFFAAQFLSIGIQFDVPSIALPIGISFYTFQTLSYLVDVYRQEAPVQKRFLNLLLYISMFPQLIAGPIVRYDTVAREITSRKVSSTDVSEGLFRFLIGLGKKVILANQFSEIANQFLVSGLPNLSTSGAWIGIFAFTFQIYYDFSGYSDMAIGIGRCLGFHFNENFNHPYCCNSITDFWRRWHISLGSFFRDYVYIPLGGNRKHQAFNILFVWTLTGMWHGASWNFIIWGLYFGIIISIEKFTILRLKSKIFAPFLHLYSLLLVVIGWGIFYFDDFSKMQHFFNAFFGNVPNGIDFLTTTALTDNFWLWAAAILFAMPIRRIIASLFDRFLGRFQFVHGTLLFTTRLVISICLLILSVALLVGATNNAFIYTRF